MSHEAIRPGFVRATTRPDALRLTQYCGARRSCISMQNLREARSGFSHSRDSQIPRLIKLERSAQACWGVWNTGLSFAGRGKSAFVLGNERMWTTLSERAALATSAFLAASLSALRFRIDSLRIFARSSLAERSRVLRTSDRESTCVSAVPTASSTGGIGAGSTFAEGVAATVGILAGADAVTGGLDATSAWRSPTAHHANADPTAAIAITPATIGARFRCKKSLSCFGNGVDVGAAGWNGLSRFADCDAA